MLKYGFPLAYYVDSHSIFRFVQGRDSFWRNHYKLTDEADPQWKQVLDDCRVKVTYALSPAASQGEDRKTLQVDSGQIGKDLLQREYQGYQKSSINLELPCPKIQLQDSSFYHRGDTLY